MESDLTTLLKTLCPRVTPEIAPTSTTKPYVTYQQIGGDVINPINNDAPGRRCAVLQINVFSDKRAEAVALIDLIEDAMRSFHAARPQAAKFTDYDHDMLVYSS
ncbi:MAG TPA: DUF3168 domain-containing protein, partial [Mycobacterium sp.]